METNLDIDLNLQTGEVCPISVSMEVYGSFEACADLAPRWDAFVESVSGDIFLTYDWCRIWWKYYGTDRQLRLYVFRLDDRWVGLMPMFLETVRLGPFSLRRAKMVGSDFSLGQFRPAIEDEFLRPVMEVLLADLRLLSCDQVVLGPIAGLYAQYPELMKALRESGAGDFLPPVELRYPQTYYRLADDYDEWLNRFKASQRGNIRRDYRNLEKQALTFMFEQADEGNLEEMFEDFIELHQAFWNSQGKLGHFDDWPQARRFHREMARAQLKKGRLRLFCLCCADGSRAYAYRYRCGDMYFGLLLARTLNTPQGVSPSRLLHSEVVKHAIGESVRWIDAMRGSYEFKGHLGGECFEQRTILLSRRGLFSRLRGLLFKAAGRTLHLVYYKFYYSRLATKLPLHRRRKLWGCWIRACGELRGATRNFNVHK